MKNPRVREKVNVFDISRIDGTLTIKYEKKIWPTSSLVAGAIVDNRVTTVAGLAGGASLITLNYDVLLNVWNWDMYFIHYPINPTGVQLIERWDEWMKRPCGGWVHYTDTWRVPFSFEEISNVDLYQPSGLTMHGCDGEKEQEIHAPPSVKIGPVGHLGN